LNDQGLDLASLVPLAYRGVEAADCGQMPTGSVRVPSPGRGVTMTDRAELLKRISIDPKVCFGKPCIRGHRIWVSLILDFLASGATVPEILEDYPGLEEADIRACIAYGAEMARERFVEIPIETAR
jgi:uncharacterized protein (DUF433 family)